MAKEYGKADAKVETLKPEEMGGAPTPEKLGRMFAEHDSDAPGTEQAPDPSPFSGDPAPAPAPKPAAPKK
jgi:hypothetical protein